MPSPRCNDGPRRGKGSVRIGQSRHRFRPFLAIYVYYEEAGTGPGSEPDVRLGPLLPPQTDLLLFDGRAFEAVREARVFARAAADTFVTAAAAVSFNAVQWEYREP